MATEKENSYKKRGAPFHISSGKQFLTVGTATDKILDPAGVLSTIYHREKKVASKRLLYITNTPLEYLTLFTDNEVHHREHSRSRESSQFGAPSARCCPLDLLLKSQPAVVIKRGKL